MEKTVAMSRNEMLLFGKDSSRENRTASKELDRGGESYEEKKVKNVISITTNF